jgi:hypothetical protein
MAPFPWGRAGDGRLRFNNQKVFLLVTLFDIEPIKKRRSKKRRSKECQDNKYIILG